MFDSVLNMSKYGCSSKYVRVLNIPFLKHKKAPFPER